MKNHPTAKCVLIAIATMLGAWVADLSACTSITPPCHYAIHNADGKCIVIEIVKGKMNVPDN